MPYLMNAWYVAAYADEIAYAADGPLFHRRLLEQDVVVFRTHGGECVALADRCPHRFAPLHLGCVVGDSLRCGYHGLRFDRAGRCVENPHGNGFIPRNAFVRTYPVRERYGLVWIWMGDAALADAAPIPDFSYLVDARRAVVAGRHVVACNHQVVGDNLADLTHVQYVHGGYQTSEDFDRATYESVQDGRRVQNRYFLANVRVSPLWGRYLKDDTLMVDRWMETTWDAPGLFTIDAGVTRPGDTRENRLGSVVAAHLLTPETMSSTHYFYAHTRDYHVADPAMDEVVREWQRVGFRQQDQAILEAVQERMGGRDLLALDPVLLATDAGAMRIRRQLARLVAEEAAADAAPARAVERAS